MLIQGQMCKLGSKKISRLYDKNDFFYFDFIFNSTLYDKLKFEKMCCSIEMNSTNFYKIAAYSQKNMQMFFPWPTNVSIMR